MLSTIQVDDFLEGPRLERYGVKRLRSNYRLDHHPSLSPVKSTIVFTFLVTCSSTFF